MRQNALLTGTAARGGTPSRRGVEAHHSDRAFASAIRNGTREHHWYFGDMPAVTAASPTDVGQIVAFLRWLQKAEDMYY